jgi:hypothetical protein
MRAWLPLPTATAVLSVMLAGCGSPGDPMPPALNRPMRTADLAIVERGANIHAVFTLPLITTENLPIQTPPEIEVRVGAIGDRFVQADWEQTSDVVPPEAIKVENGRAEAVIPVAKYVGRTVVVGVRLHGPKGRHNGWAVDVVNVLPELPTPGAVAAREVPGGVELNWNVAKSAAGFRIFRRDANAKEKEWALIGTSDKTSFVDAGAEYGKAYDYYVQTTEKSGEKYAESESSSIVSIQPTDKFAPDKPAGLTAVPATKSIELVWDSNKEADLAFYRVYRDNVMLADKVPAASFSDRDVVGGAKHSYEVTAVDTANNESPRSGAVEAVLP